MRIIRRILNRIFNFSTVENRLSRIERSISVERELIKENKFLLGQLLTQRIKSGEISTFNDSEFKVFSQWGEDGLIQFLINKIEGIPQTFVEFGVETYNEANTRFLLENNNWSGVVLDGSESNINFIKNQNYFWRHNLSAVEAFITEDNINSLIKGAGYSGEIGILSVDIDGNDYWVWKAIDCVNPVIIIVEYNSLFGYKNPWSTIYDAAFVRSEKHYSNIYYGTSLLSACDLAEARGYSLVGCNENGNNAFFVRNDSLNNIKVQSPEKAYRRSKFREERTQNGKLTFASFDERCKTLEGLEIFNTRSNQIEKISFT